MPPIPAGFVHIGTAAFTLHRSEQYIRWLCKEGKVPTCKRRRKPNARRAWYCDLAATKAYLATPGRQPMRTRWETAPKKSLDSRPLPPVTAEQRREEIQAMLANCHEILATKFPNTNIYNAAKAVIARWDNMI